MPILGLLLMFGGIFFVFMGLINLSDGGMAFFILALGGAMSYGGYWLASQPEVKMKKYREELASLNEYKDGKYKHMYKTCAIAVHPDKQKIFLANGAKIKYYNFNDVREWSYKIVTNGGVVAGAGLIGHLDNISSTIKGYEESGLFINVRDVENPVWHIHFESENLKDSLNKWMEILRQSINES